MNGNRDGTHGYEAPAALYVHVPICASKCLYCDFFSLPVASLSGDFEMELVEATLARASSLAERFGAEHFDTVYIGGGTPSLLSARALDRLLGGIATLARDRAGRGPGEWTIEANPDSFGPTALATMRKHGVTRLSVGVQSLVSGDLATLGRRHGPEAALGAVRLAAESGLAVSADLIAGIPRPRDERRYAPGSARGTTGLAAQARQLLEAGATHLSVYDLTIEEASPLAAMRGSLRFPDQDEEHEARLLLESFLTAVGMRRYEVSNYASSGRECRHNLTYWHMDSYIGAGPGAVSTLAGPSGTSLRIEEPREIVNYRSRAGETAAETEISLRDAAFESIMMAFRTSFGLDLDAFKARFGIDAADLIGESMAAWKGSLVEGEPWPGRGKSGGLALNGGGLDLLNRFLVACLEEIETKTWIFV